eukprot:UC1_evm1s583
MDIESSSSGSSSDEGGPPPNEVAAPPVSAPPAEANLSAADTAPAVAAAAVDEKFPKDQLINLNAKIYPASWTVPVKQGQSFDVCMRAYHRIWRLGKAKEDDSADSFFRQALPFCIGKLVDSAATPNWNNEVHQQIYQLLRTFVELASDLLPENHAHVWGMLEVVFNPNSAFHRKNIHSEALSDTVVVSPHAGGVGGGGAVVDAAGVAGKDGDMEPNMATVYSTQEPHGWLVDLINLFAECGGFEALKTLAEKEDTNALTLMNCLRAFGASAKFLTQRCITEYIRPIEERGVAMLAALDGKELHKVALGMATDETLWKVAICLRQLRPILHPGRAVEVEEEAKNLLLQLVLRLLKGESFPGAMGAIGTLKQLMELSMRPPGSWVSLHLFTKEQLADWVLSENVLRIAFARDSMDKTQYVDRLEDVVKHLMLTHRLTVEHLAIIWDSQKDKYEVIVQNVHDLLARLAWQFDAEHLEHLFACFKQSWGGTDKEMTSLVTFVRRLAEDDTQGDMATNALDVLWTLSQDAETPQNIVGVTLSAHHRILGDSSIVDKEAQRRRWILLCLDCLGHERRLLTDLLKHLRHLIELHAKEGARHNYNYVRGEWRHEVIESLNTGKNIKQRIVKLLTDYVTEARSWYSASGSDMSLADATVEGYASTHHEVVSTLLNFFVFIIWDGRIWMSLDEAKTLWACLVGDAPAKDHAVRNFALQFFADSMSTQPDMENQVLLSFFEEAVLTLDPETLGENGFRCFSNGFDSTNLAFGSLFLTTSHKITTVKLDLKGLPFLWDVALRNPDENIAAQSVTLLKRIFSQLSADFEGEAAVVGTFLDDIMQRLSQARLTLARNADSGDLEGETRMVRCIQRCLSLIDKYVLSFGLDKAGKGPGQKQQRLPHGQAFQGEPLKLCVRTLEHVGLPDAKVNTHGNAKVLALRIAVACQLSYSYKFVGLMVGDKKLPPALDDQTLHNVGIGPDSELSFFPADGAGGARHEGATSITLVESYDQLPSVQLSLRTDYVGWLLELAESSIEAVRVPARNVLSHMPTDPQLLARLTACDMGESTAMTAAENLRAVFGADLDSYKALYTMQVLCSLILPNGAGAKQQSVFSAGPVATAVSELLVSVIGRPSTVALGTYHCDDRREIVRLCLRMLLSFFQQHGGEKQPVWPEQLDGSVLLEILTNLLWAAGTSRLHLPGDVGLTKSSGATLAPGDAAVACDTLSLLDLVFGALPELAGTFLSAPQMPHMVHDLLVSCPAHNVRSAMASRLGIMGSMHECAASVWRLISDNFDSALNAPDTCSEYFGAASKCLALVVDAGVLIDLDAMLEAQVSWITASVAATTPLSQTLLAGQLRLCTALLSRHASGRQAAGAALLGLLFDRFLFPTSLHLAELLAAEAASATASAAANSTIADAASDGTAPVLKSAPLPATDLKKNSPEPICVSTEARQEGLNLVVALVTGCKPNLELALERLGRFHFTESFKHKCRKWGTHPIITPRRAVGYCGLKNPGCTCYMNSVLQQMYMQPDVRASVLNIAHVPPEAAEETFIYQLTTTFAHLSGGQMLAYAPSGVWRTYRQWGGQDPIDIREQMDVHDFFDSLSDQVDETLKKEGKDPVFQPVFGVQIDEQKIVTKGCDHRFSRIEQGLGIKVQVRNQGNLKTALELWAKGEILDDYKCEICDDKRSILKRPCIKMLPPTLIVQLKRFDFDFERLEPVKFNDEFRFDDTLDMGPYTVEGVEAAEAMSRGEAGMAVPENLYSLVGVVVHSGQCGGGHYYSFARERSAAGRLTDRRQWIKFDDSSVTEVDMDESGEREREWFGGEYMDSLFDRASGRNINKTMERSWNAYMLIYERMDAASAAAAAVSPKTSVESNVSVAGLSVSDGSAAAAGGNVFDSRLSSVADASVSALVRRHNLEFNHNRDVFNQAHYAFMRDICASNAKWLDEQVSASATADVATSENIEAIGVHCARLGTEFLRLFGYRTRNNLRGPLEEWPKAMGRIFKAIPAAAEWYLDENIVRDPDVLCMHLLECTSAEVRDVYGRILSSALAAVAQSQGVEAGRARADQVFDIMLPWLKKQCGENWKHMNEYFDVFYQYALLGPEQRAHIIDREVIEQCISFMCYDYDWTPYQNPDYTNVHRLVSTLVRSSDLSARETLAADTKVHPPNPFCDASDKARSPLSENLAALLFVKNNYIFRAITDYSGLEEVQMILQAASWRNIDFSRAVLYKLLFIVRQTELRRSVELMDAFGCLEMLLNFTDGLQLERFQIACEGYRDAKQHVPGLFFIGSYFRQSQARRTYICLKFVLKVADQHPSCIAYLGSVSSEWDWFPAWLNAVLNGHSYGVHNAANPSPVSNEKSNSVLLERSRSAYDLLAHLRENFESQSVPAAAPAAAAPSSAAPAYIATRETSAVETNIGPTTESDTEYRSADELTETEMTG